MELLSIIPMVAVIVAAVVQTVILVVFFLLANNVAEIKKQLNRRPTIKEYIDMAAEEKYIGNKEKAKEYLFRAKYQLENIKESLFIPGLGWNKEAVSNIEKLLSEL